MKRIGVRAIHHIAVQTSNFERAISFYRDVLGVDVVETRSFKRRRMAWLGVGDVLIELFSKREGEDLEPWSDFYSGPVHLAFVVDDLTEFLAEAQRQGVYLHPSHPEPFMPPVPGARMIAYLLGPDGEEIEVRER
jgi:catechol 2,3-dioxygenase-like lactoylglutathione lyase family enzyme